MVPNNNNNLPIAASSSPFHGITGSLETFPSTSFTDFAATVICWNCEHPSAHQTLLFYVFFWWTLFHIVTGHGWFYQTPYFYNTVFLHQDEACCGYMLIWPTYMTTVLAINCIVLIVTYIIVVDWTSFHIKYNKSLLYSQLLLHGPNICKICEHHLNLQKFLLIAKTFNASVWTSLFITYSIIN